MSLWYRPVSLGSGGCSGGLNGRGAEGTSQRANKPLLLTAAGIWAVWIATIGGLLSLLGCASLARPNWRHPGTAQMQQLRAHQFDPYPEDDLGPSVEGARPMEFLHPPWEIQRCRPHELRRRWFGWQIPLNSPLSHPSLGIPPNTP